MSQPDPAVLVSVISVSWNGREDLAACLDALRGQRCRRFEVVVVDNDSRCVRS